VEPGQDSSVQSPSGQNPSGQNPSGWHRDPLGRFEYRYFNGVQWTSDVSINGQRYVDAPVAHLTQQPPKRPPRGMAIASMILGISAVVLGWVPFVFVIAAGAAIAGLVLGILGMQNARRNEGYGRGFAVTGLVLAPIALVVCVGGFFLTRAVIREFRDFIEPGPHELVVEQPCTLENGLATVNGTIRNTDDREHDYRIFVDFDDGDDTKSSTVPVRDVAPGQTVPWTSSVTFSGDTVECTVSDVFGPAPFGIDQD
jgi:hypothetical protein